MKKQKLSITAIRKIMKEVVFDPKKNAPLRVISEQEDINYHLHSAIVSIESAKRAPGRAQLIMAIRSLLFAIWYS